MNKKYENKKSNILTDNLIFLIFLAIALATLVYIFAPKILGLTKTGIELVQFDTDNMNDEKPTIEQGEKEIKGEADQTSPPSGKDVVNNEKSAAQGGDTKKEIGTVPLAK